jgi:hypothetical protein
MGQRGAPDAKGPPMDLLPSGAPAVSKAGPQLLSTKDGRAYGKFGGRRISFGRIEDPDTAQRFDAFKARWLLNGRELSDDMLGPRAERPGVVTLDALAATCAWSPASPRGSAAPGRSSPPTDRRGRDRHPARRRAVRRRGPGAWTWRCDDAPSVQRRSAVRRALGRGQPARRLRPARARRTAQRDGPTWRTSQRSRAT